MTMNDQLSEHALAIAAGHILQEKFIEVASICEALSWP